MPNRFNRRVDINDEIEVVTPNGMLRCMLENISLGGLFIRTDKNIHVGDEIEIATPIHNDSRMMILAAKLKAIRIENRGIAFKFDDIDHQNFWTLQSFIQSVHS
ncbi:MAG: PilZ domain-containing protein [Deltaproteobacteria bacterium]